MSARARVRIGAALCGAVLCGAASAAVAPLGAQTAPSPAPDTAQSGRGLVSLRGVVTSDGQPVDSAEVEVFGGTNATIRPPIQSTRRPRGYGAGGTVRSGSAGEYQLAGLRPGQYWVRVRRLGFSPVYFSATLAAGERRQIDVRLDRLPVQLSEVTVRGQSGYGRALDRQLAAFEWRRRSGWGRFLTRDDLKRYGAAPVSEAIRFASLPLRSECTTQSPVAIGDGMAGPARYADRFLATGISGTGPWGALPGGCGIRVSLNGNLPVSPDLAPDLPTEWVEAVEIYSGRFAPAEFGTRGPVVVLWTLTQTAER